MIIGIRRVSTRLPSQLKNAQSLTPVSSYIRRSFPRQKSTMADFKVVFTKDAAARKSYIQLFRPIALLKQVPTVQQLTNYLPAAGPYVKLSFSPQNPSQPSPTLPTPSLSPTLTNNPPVPSNSHPPNNLLLRPNPLHGDR
jgi:hypothetical protein